MQHQMVYLGAHRMPLKERFFYALEARTGALVWRYALPDAFSSSYPVVTPTGVYFSMSNGYVYALHPTGGQLLWQQHIHQQVPSSPVIANGLLYISTSDAVSVLRATDGSLQWQQPVADLTPWRPVVTSERVCVVSKNGSVSVLHTDDGSLLWRTPGTGRGETRTSVAATQERVYLVVLGRGLSALRASDGALLWHQPMRSAGLYDPLIHQGMLYLNTDGSIQARREIDGSVLWRVQTHGKGSLAAMNNMLFVSGDGGLTSEVSALGITDGSLVWHWSTSVGQSGITVPVVADETVYIGMGATGGFYALSANDGSMLWHTLSDMSVTAAAVSEKMLENP